MSITLIKQLSWRYLRGKRSGNAVPVLSRISMVAIAVGAGAMIVLFSVFNGFEGIVKEMYKAFYPDVKVTTAKGKFFSIDDETFQQLKTVDGVAVVSSVLEDNVLLQSETEERVATIKGVDKEYFKVNNVEPYVQEGNCAVTAEGIPTAVVGTRLMAELGLDVYNVFNRMIAFYPNPKATPGTFSLSPDNAFTSLKLRPDGEFTIQDEFDSKYVLADIGLVQSLVMEEGKYSSIELAIKPGYDVFDVKEEIQSLLGAKYDVATRYEQNRTLYLVMRSEKWAVYGILVLVLLIAAFNMVGALSLLVMEKQKDISILKAMGATNGDVSKVFVTEGVLWSLLGGGVGLLIGGLLCFGQQQFGWIKLGGSFIIDAYPVQLQLSDFVLILATVAVIGMLAAWFPSVRASRIQTISLRAD
ncbi:MAG: FtsX-like permease family protein [Chitinophagales bacterium]|nr:FtsX-like permease family protein [Chitinophagaceae bacterium]MCB9065801.1 FtsX-like permease family protein [Chitinophagales bacterium]